MDRQNNFDALRLVAATSVIFSHAFLLAENSQDHDPLMLLTGGQTILGLAGVFMFFTISGFLVTQSFDNTRSPLVFLVKRGLRIFPGLVACLLVCAFAVGPLVTSLELPEYFGRGEPYAFVLRNSLLNIEYNRLPGVEFWPGNIGGIVNGPLWSLPCEALMYLMLCGIGVCGWLILGVAMLLAGVGVVGLWVSATDLLGGFFWLLAPFATGMCCYRLRDHPGFWRPRWVLLALLGLVLSIPAKLFLIAFAVFGGYLTIWLALTPRLRPLPAARYGDLSYGLYIYGWPVEQCVVYLSRGQAPWWVVFGIALPVTAAIAFLSWHLVERRCRWRGRRTPRLPRAVADPVTSG